MALAIMCIVCCIILFTVLMDSKHWYWGVIGGIGLFIILRSFYGCCTSSENPNINTKSSVPRPTAPDEEDPTPPH
jgi:hypothetical protein